MKAGRPELVNVQLPGGGVGRRWRVVCGQCSAEECGNHNTQNEGIVTRNLTRKGWRFVKGGVMCAACAAPVRGGRGGVGKEGDDMSKLLSKDVINAARVAEVLGMCWQDQAGAYDAGWDDAKVGRELGGLAPDFVRSVREAMGKVPKRSPELVEAEARLAELVAGWEALVKELKDVKFAVSVLQSHSEQFSHKIDDVRGLLDRAGVR